MGTEPHAFQQSSASLEAVIRSGAPHVLRLMVFDSANFYQCGIDIALPTGDPDRLDELMPILRDAFEKVLSRAAEGPRE